MLHLVDVFLDIDVDGFVVEILVELLKMFLDLSVDVVHHLVDLLW
jgi:hypothetical protein